jgi:hypothetical protein
MKAIGQSIEKPDNDVYETGMVRPNEDALYISDERIVVCDGAGGTGIFADKWAGKLVESTPDKPFADVKEMDEWIEGIWENFYNEYLPLLKNDPWKIKKFEEEGTSSTFLALWNVEKNRFVCQTYGDTVWFLFNKETGDLNIQENMSPVNSFNVNPPLINWQTERLEEKDFYSRVIELKDNEQLIIATDGMAMYIYGAFLASTKKIDEDITETKMQKIVEFFNENPVTDFSLWLNELKDTLKDKNTFQALTKNWFENKALPNDDYTVVFVEGK